MKKIVLNGPTPDNVGGFHDGGAELAIGDANKAGFITVAAAKDLVARHAAVTKSEKASATPAMTKPMRAAPKKAVPALAPAPTPRAQGDGGNG